MTVVGESVNITFTLSSPHPKPEEERQRNDLVTIRLNHLAVKLLNEALTSVVAKREEETGEIKVPPDALEISEYSAGAQQ